MENSKIGARSSSAKIDRIVCKLVKANQDISQATQRSLKIADNEYFRALKIHQSTRTPAKKAEMQEKAIYTMDKLIRERLKKGSFGYNNSKLLNLQQDLKENTHFLNDSSLLMQKLKEESNVRPSGMSYSDWLRQKTAAERIKNKLKVKIKRVETENMLKQEQIDEEVFMENQVAVERWMKKKKKEAFKAKKDRKKEKFEKDREKITKAAQGEEAYRNWLREKIKEDCAEYEKKKKESKEEKKKIAQDKLKEAEFKLRCEQAYQEWLEKVKAGRNCVSRKNSLGRKKLGSEQESYYLSI